MTLYLVSFDDGAMVIPEGELPAVADAAHAVMREEKAAGVWVTGGGILGHELSVVDTDGSVTDVTYSGSKPHLGGFVVIDVASRDEALAWAAKTAAACRCPQEVWEVMSDPEV